MNITVTLFVLCLCIVFSDGISLHEDDISHIDESCKWHMDLLRISASGTIRKIQRINVRHSKIHIRESSNLLGDKAFKYFSINGTMTAYQNMIRLSVYCNEVYSRSASLTVAQQDFRLYVHITSSPMTKDGNHTGLLVNTFQGALTDNSVLSQKAKACSKLLCDPVWIVPLPIYDNVIYIIIAVEETPRVLYSAPLREYLYINPFFSGTYLFGDSQNFTQAIADKLISQGIQTIEATSGVSVMDMIGIGTEHLLVSDDHWTTVTPVKVQFKGITAMTDLCTGEQAPRIKLMATASPSGNIYFATNIGLIQQSFNRHGHLSSMVVLRKCLRRLKVPKLAMSHIQLMLAFSSEDDTDGLYYSQQGIKNPEFDQRWHSEFTMVNISSHCNRRNNCSILDADFDGSELGCVIILIKLGIDNPQYKILKYSIADMTVGGVLLEFSGYVIKTESSAHYFSLLTAGLAEDLDLHLKGLTTPDPSLFCAGCYQKIPVDIRTVALHPLSNTNLILTGSHIIHGVIGGRFYCLSDVHKNSDFKLQSINRQGIAVFYTSIPDKELYLWMFNSYTLRQLYPSHGWTLFTTRHHRHMYSDPMNHHTMISMEFLFEGKLLILLADPDAITPNKTLVMMEVDIIAVVKYSDESNHAEKRKLNNDISATTVSSPKCNYEITFGNKELLSKTGTQHNDWHMFPIARANHTYLHSLSNIITNQLLVYNFVTSSMRNVNDNATSSYSNSISAISMDNNMPEYSFGVTRSNKLSRRPYHKTDKEDKLPQLLYMDKGSRVQFHVFISLVNVDSTDPVLDEVDLSLELSSHFTDLVTVQSSRQIDYFRNRAAFEINVTVNDSEISTQELPGDNLVPVSLTLQSSIADLQCAKYQPEKALYELNGLQSMKMMIGCPPQQTPFYDLQKSIDEMEENQLTHLYCLNRKGKDHDNCFYFQHTFYPHFGIVDSVSGQSRPFTGKYTLKVIGGGSSRNKITRYSTSEIRQYNSFNQSNGLEYLMITPGKYNPAEMHDGFPVYHKGDNTILWHCDSKSPCASPPPTDWGIPEYFFLLRFSNKGVDDTTHCQFELTFVVTVFGYKLGQQDYAVLLGTLIVLVTHVIMYYFWKTRYYWLAKLHRNDNVAVKKLLSLGRLASVASQASLKNQLLEAIYNDDTLMLTDALAKAEESKGDDLKRNDVSKLMLSMAKDKIGDNLRKKLEKQIADHDIKGMGLTVGEMVKLNLVTEADQGVVSKAKKILAKKANVVLKLIDVMHGQNHKELADCLTRYKEIMPEETVENNSLVRQATVHLTSILTKQLLKSLKKKDTWEIHYAIKEFKNHKIVDKFNLLPKAEQAIYYRLTGKLRKAIKQGTPQLLRDAIADTERDLDFHDIKDRDMVINEAKSLLYKILKDKLAEELKKRDSMKIRNAINRFAFYGVADASGFLEKANKNLYNIVIPPIAKNLETAKTPDEIHRIVTRIRAELNKYGLQDKDKVASKAEKLLYDAIAKQLQTAIKAKAKPKDLAVILTASIMSRKQYKINQDLRKLEESAKTLLYKQLVPFLLKILKGPTFDVKQLAASIVAARIEFSRIGIEDPGGLVDKAEDKLYELTFGPLKEMVEYSKDSKALWTKMKNAQVAIREYGVRDKENLLFKAEIRFAELITMELDEGSQRKDVHSLRNLKEFLKLVSHPHKLEFLQSVEKHIKEVSGKVNKMNAYLQSHTTEYRNLCEELKYATTELNVTGNIQAIMPIIIRFETSGFPDNDGVQKTALVAVADIVDAEFKRHMADENYAKIALLREVVNTAAMEPKIKDLYYLLTVICGKYITVRSDIEMAIVDKSLELSKHIQSLDLTLKSLKSLKLALPAYYMASVTRLEEQMRELMERAEENAAFFISIEEIRTDLTQMNPVDIIQLERYTIVPKLVFEILRAFLTILGKPFVETERWMDVQSEIRSYSLVSGLLSEAQNFSYGSIDMLQLLDARDFCEPHLAMTNVSEESSAEQTTLAVILKWILLVINESTLHFIESGGDLEDVVGKFRSRRNRRKESGVLKDVRKDATLHGKALNHTEKIVSSNLIQSCQDVLRPEWTSSYIARWVKAYPFADGTNVHFRNMVTFKQSLKLFNLYYNYAPPELLLKYGSIIEYTGSDKNGKPVFLCQFGKIDLEGLVKSFRPSQVMLHFLFLMEMIEHKCKASEFNSILIVDCSSFQNIIQSFTLEALGWFHAMTTLMSRIYPALFKTVYVVNGSKYKKITDKFSIPLFESQPGLQSVFLEGEIGKETIYNLVEKQYLPQTMGGTYNINGHLNSPSKIPNSHYLVESERYSRTHWTSVIVESGVPKSFSYKQERTVIGALLLYSLSGFVNSCEFEPDGAIDVEINFTPTVGSGGVSKKSALVTLNRIDHLYSNHFDASRPGIYQVVFTHGGSWSKRTVRYEAGLANTIEEIREYVFKLETDEEGNLSDIIGPRLISTNQ